MSPSALLPKPPQICPLNRKPLQRRRIVRGIWIYQRVFPPDSWNSLDKDEFKTIWNPMSESYDLLQKIKPGHLGVGFRVVMKGPDSFAIEIDRAIEKARFGVLYDINGDYIPTDVEWDDEGWNLQEL